MQLLEFIVEPSYTFVILHKYFGYFLLVKKLFLLSNYYVYFNTSKEAQTIK